MKNDGTFKVTTPSDREIAMTRLFDAGRSLVFEALTTPHLVQQWLLGPPGWTMPICEIDLRVGGVYRFIWSGAGGKQMGVSGVYHEIAPPERLVAAERFDDPWYPGEALVTYSMVEQNGQTTLTLTMLCDSKEARDGILKTGMERGVAISFDRLEEILAVQGAPR